MPKRDLRERPGIDPRADQVAARLRALADPVRLRLLALLARGDCPVGLLAAATGVGQSLVSFHLGVLREADLLSTERVGRFTYVRLRPEAVGALFDDVGEVILPVAAHPPSATGDSMRTVIFACVHNAGRSQMAAAFFNAFAPAGLGAVSAGTQPADRVHPEVVQVMAEVGIDVAGAVPQLLSPELAAGAELLVTMGCGEQCPVVPVPRQDWPLPDPKGRPLDEVRAVRDDIRARVMALLAELQDPGDGQDLDADERAAVHRLVAKLHSRFERMLGAGRVERIVREEVVRGRSARIRTYIDIFTERNACERLRALAQAEGRLAKHVPELLFVCVHNAGRSQMAAALAEHLGQGRVHAWSAGTDPGPGLHTEAVAVMREIGVDLAGNAPKPWTNELVRAADVVVTMGCGDNCPWFPGVRYLDWPVDDPAGKTLEEARAIRDDVRARVEDLIESVTATPATTTR